KQPIVSLRLLLNGRPLPDGKGLKECGKDALSAGAEWELTLPPGKHELKVLARSEDAAELSNVVEENVPEKKENRPILHTLCIGVNKYKEDGLELKAAVNDATALNNALKASCVGADNLFGDCRPKLLTDATRAQILDELTDIRQAV